jgi:exosortase family protein XrtG
MNMWLGAIFGVIWLYVLHVMNKAQLKAWKFAWGSCGLFIIMMIFIRPYLTQPLAEVVAAVAGIIGDLTGMYSSYFKYGVIFIDSAAGAITLQIDFECSGILEIMAFISLLVFFDVYSVFGRIILSVVGTIYIILANALRITVICGIIHVFGVSAYHVAHTIVGRIIFYGLSVILYFVVFTKTQIIRQKVGGFTYGHDQ